VKPKQIAKAILVFFNPEVRTNELRITFAEEKGRERDKKYGKGRLDYELDTNSKL